MYFCITSLLFIGIDFKATFFQYRFCQFSTRNANLKNMGAKQTTDLSTASFGAVATLTKGIIIPWLSEIITYSLHNCHVLEYQSIISFAFLLDTLNLSFLLVFSSTNWKGKSLEIQIQFHSSHGCVVLCFCRFGGLLQLSAGIRGIAAAFVWLMFGWARLVSLYHVSPRYINILPKTTQDFKACDEISEASDWWSATIFKK